MLLYGLTKYGIFHVNYSTPETLIAITCPKIRRVCGGAMFYYSYGNVEEERRREDFNHLRIGRAKGTVKTEGDQVETT